MTTIFFLAVAAALSLAVAGLLAMALLRGRQAAGSAAAEAARADMRVYRDQLDEVERDLERGVLSPEEAERVRVEVSRRLLEADRAAQAAEAAQASDPGRLSRIAAAAVVALVLGLAGGLYWWIGAPGYDDVPLAERLAQADAAMAERPSQAEAEAANPRDFTPPPGTDPEYLALMDRLRAAVAQKPDELQGQILLARNEALLGNYRAAHRAMAQVIALKGAEADSIDRAAYLELLVAAVDGYVSPEAEAVARQILQDDPMNGAARYYLGLMYAQGGRPDRAYEIWWQLLSQSTRAAPWVEPVLAQLPRVAEEAGIRYVEPQIAPDPRAAPPAADLPGPTEEDVQAAGQMEAGDRQAMIRSMVDRLAERLAGEGGSAEEWARLINALGVLGETGRAAETWAEAQQTFAGDAAALATIRAAAERAGVAE